jgi:glutamate-1-semialdehyde 2,1-aminomutase
VIKFRGHYHGWSDSIHFAVPGHLDGPGTAGQDPMSAQSLVVCEWNSVEALEAVLTDDVAAIIMEPIAINGGCLLSAPGYLAEVRRLADATGAVLIFDEVITGFRAALGGAQEFFGVIPDLTILGKALGAGFPISAVCGRRDFMAVVASRRVAHVGTFNANPVCAAAALAAVTELERSAETVYPRLACTMDGLARDLVEGAEAEGFELAVNHVGAAGHAFASAEPVENVEQVDRTDLTRYRAFAAALLAEGVHVIPRGLLYVSTAHTDDELARTREAVQTAAACVRSAGRISSAQRIAR